MLLWGALAGVLLAGCSGGETEAPSGSDGRGSAPPAEAAAAATTGSAPAAQPAATAELASRGEQVYRSACSACHAFDPSEDGAVGPALAGSSLELLRAKVLHNEYPPGYAPKRETRMMVPLPHVEDDLPALAAYLERAARGG